MEFTKEEIETAEAVKKQMMEKETPDTLKAIYIAGEICMWKELQDQSIKGEWVDVKERLPELGQKVLSLDVHGDVVSTKYRTYQKGSIGFERGDKECWFEFIVSNRCYSQRNVTHWQPLPELPTLSESK